MIADTALNLGTKEFKEKVVVLSADQLGKRVLFAFNLEIDSHFRLITEARKAWRNSKTVLVAITRQQNRALEEQEGLELAELEKEIPFTTPMGLGEVGITSHGTSVGRQMLG